MRSICAFAVAALMLPAGPLAAADTEVESMRELPLQRGGPIVGGKRQQPTQAEIQERQAERSMAPSSRSGTPSVSGRERDGQSRELYNKVIQQSDQPTPRSIDPSQ